MSYRLLRPLLFCLEAERAHAVTLGMLEIAATLKLTRVVTAAVPPMPTRVMGLDFPNPVGLAAGLDKNAEHVDALSSLGFGFIEVGTVTPRPQPGNPPPRLFRVPEAAAIINRMGFNNLGIERLVRNLAARRSRTILGINVGKSFDTAVERAAADYLACMRKAYPVADYLVVNVSSPNTPNLRQLQNAEELEALLAALKAEQRSLAKLHRRYVPLAIKVAPDLTAEHIEAIGALLVDHGIDAVIATNTTISRIGVAGLRHGDQAGGLSGAPLRGRATEVVRALHASTGGRIPIIAVGGILSGEDAREKMAAGASLVQLYTGLIYRGPSLVAECVRALAARY